jgi:hypothetical protein
VIDPQNDFSIWSSGASQRRNGIDHKTNVYAFRLVYGVKPQEVRFCFHTDLRSDRKEVR